MGINATLLHLESEDEYNEVNAELILRFSSYSSQFWVDGDAQGNDSYTVFADGYRRTLPSRDGSQPAGLYAQRLCIYLNFKKTDPLKIFTLNYEPIDFTCKMHWSLREDKNFSSQCLSNSTHTD